MLRYRALLALMAAVLGWAWVGVRGWGPGRAAGTVYAAGEVKGELEHPDMACRSCHAAIYDRYEKTPMARGSGLAIDGLVGLGGGTGGLLHKPSGVRYALAVRDGQLYLHLDRPRTTERAGVDEEERLDYFIGSGRRGRTYLYEREGLWFEAPINWYSKKQVWDMAPAYEHATGVPGPLPVDANCLHCHATEVGTETGGARNHFAGVPFREGGVGCASCHGDPAQHLAGVHGGGPGSGPILNPAKLRPGPRDAVCLQCHLEGDATVYRPGQSLATFKPGEELWDSAVYFVDRTKAMGGGRATSQYEAMLRSACKRGAGDKLTCTSCHDPHSSPAPEERVAFFRSKCLGCHTGVAMATTHHPEQKDCASCHMPTRTTVDISHEQMTDHDIEARPRKQTRAAEAHLHEPDLVPVGEERVTPREQGLAYAQFAERGDRAAGERAMKLLETAEKNGSDDVELHEQLGFLLQVSGAVDAALKEYRTALREDPKDVTAAGDLAVADAQTGHTEEALRLLEQVVGEDPSQSSAALNLAFLECRMNEKESARGVVRRVLAFDPDSAAAHRWLDTGAYSGQACSLR